MSVWRIFWRGAAALLLLLLIAAAAVWLLRKDIARNYADAEIKRRGIAARYQISEISRTRQRLEQISIGDPANPDLTADWAEVITATGFSGVSVQKIRAGGVRLKGRLIDGRVRFGEVDKFLPPPSDEPFALPDFDIELRDARIRIDTPYGPAAARFDGRGNIADNLSGTLAVLMPAIMINQGCNARGVSAYLKVKTASRRISADGPVRAGAVACGGVDVASAQAQIDLVTDETFARFDSEIAAETRGLSAPGVSLATTRTTARAAYADSRLKADGNFALTGLLPDAGLIDAATRFVRAGDASPLAAFGEQFARAIRGIGRASNAQARFSLEGSTSSGLVIVDTLAVQSNSGAGLRFADGARARLRWPGNAVSVDGAVTLAGGGFPASTIAFDRGSRLDRLSGVASIAPLVAGETRLAMTPLRFGYGRGGISLATTARFDGPVAGGEVRGLLVPVSVKDGRLAVECLPLSFTAFRYASLTLAPFSNRLCLRGGAVTSGPLAIRSKLGGSPLDLAVGSARYELANGRFAANGMTLQLGDPKQPTKLAMAALDGVYRGGEASGRFSGAAGQIGAVPLLLSEIGGDWTFARQALTIKGGLRVADEAKSPRYLPLASDDVALRFADNLITATGTLREPFTRTAVSHVKIMHDLGGARGKAVLDVPGLTFGKALQPERLTSVTLGVIANVEGTLTGRGEINWNERGVTSSGGFRTDNLDFAAAFGPVTGLKGEIALSDLLGLTTPPGQSVSIGSINPGVAVTDGVLRYRLLPDLKLAIEGGRWPFAGGELILAPSILDLNQSAERRLTFRVQGLDAALFVQQMAFENIAVTGRFDGLLPMVFDQNGGRIEGGNLTVREGGGTLSYIGEVSNAELGRFSKLAFDALKSIRYKRLTLELDGALDGEMVTVVRFNGVNQLPLAQNKNFFLKQFNEIPFLFNITIKAPFRGLFSMVRSFNDPSVFIPRGLQALPVAPTPPTPVQTKESETVR